jgi:periplasmic protein TonB
MRTLGEKNTTRGRRTPWVALLLTLVTNAGLFGAFAGAAWLGVELSQVTTAPIRLVLKHEVAPKPPVVPALEKVAPAAPKPKQVKKPKPRRAPKPKPRARAVVKPTPAPATPPPPQDASPQLENDEGDELALPKDEAPEDGVAMATPTDPNLRAAYLASIQGRVANGERAYPRRARRLGIEGDARLAFTVRADGSLAAIEVLESAGSSALDRAAIEYLESLAPFPVFPEGLTEESIRLRVTIEYRLQGGW